MTRTKLVAVVFAALVVTVGPVAAAPGNAPIAVGADDQYDDHAEAADGNADDAVDESSADGQPADAPVGDDAEGNADDAADRADDAGAGSTDAADRRGPPSDLPAQVPDHVAAVHDVIESFLSGDLDSSLGDAVSDATPNDDADAGAA
jgi:hypothetical protein